MLALATLWDEPNNPHAGPRSAEPSPFAVVPDEPPVDPLPPPPADEPAAADAEPAGSRRRKRQKTTLSSAFEERLREGAQGFNFDALISTVNRPEPKQPEPESEETEELLAPGSPRTPVKVSMWRAIMAIGGIVMFVFRAVGKLFGGVLGVASETAWLARRVRRVFVNLTLFAIIGFALVGGIKAYARWSTTGRLGSVVLGANPNSLRSVPDPTLTPGEVKGNGERGDIAVSVRRAVMDAYGVDPHDDGYVPMRLIPSDFGGTNSVKNIFPATPFNAQWKARLDAHLIDQVRKGSLKKEQALGELKIDWIVAARKYHIPDSVEIRLNRPKSK